MYQNISPSILVCFRWWCITGVFFSLLHFSNPNRTWRCVFYCGMIKRTNWIFFRLERRYHIINVGVWVLFPKAYTRSPYQCFKNSFIKLNSKTTRYNQRMKMLFQNILRLLLMATQTFNIHIQLLDSLAPPLIIFQSVFAIFVVIRQKKSIRHCSVQFINNFNIEFLLFLSLVTI